MAAGPIPVLFSSDTVVVINKPAPLPTNKSDFYNRANARQMLKAQLGATGRLSALHRLDACTTGVLMWSTDKATTTLLTRKIQERQVSKWYVARVSGDPFADASDRPVADRDRTPITVSTPVDGKDAVTHLYPLPSSSREGSAGAAAGVGGHSLGGTLVLCRPETGRKHQIRKHLRGLGCPVVNDPVYNPDATASAMGDPYSDAAVTQMLQEALVAHTGAADAQPDVSRLRAHLSDDLEGRPWTAGRVWTAPICLHAWVYSGQGGLAGSGDTAPWSFAAPLPAWARHDASRRPDALKRALHPRRLVFSV